MSNSAMPVALEAAQAEWQPYVELSAVDGGHPRSLSITDDH